MSAPTTIARAYPKRKRPEVSYFDCFSSDGEEEAEADLESDIESPPPKKAKVTKAANAKPLPKKKIFPFASLPAELRNKIYHYALTDSDLFLIAKTHNYRRTVEIGAPSESRESRRRRMGRFWPSMSTTTPTATPNMLPSLVPNILLLNRQIYSEAQPILYGSNCFAIEDTTALHAFCANIGLKNCATLREIRIKGWGLTKTLKAMNHPAFTLLASAVNLTRLYIDCSIHWGAPSQIAKQLYRDGHHWFEALGLAKGRADAAVEIIEVGEKHLGERYHYTNGRSMLVDSKKEDKMKEFQAELRRLLLQV